MTGGAASAAFTATPAPAPCLHCGLPTPAEHRFCCAGCAAAFDTITGLGLGNYYRQRIIDPNARPNKPDAADRFDLSHAVTRRDDGVFELTLAVDGVQCGACVWLIESVLARESGVVRGRVNMTTRRLSLAWKGVEADADRLVDAIEKLGYRLVPFDAKSLATARDQREKQLLRALAVAGFAAGNVMLISIGTWAGLTQGMGEATRALMHWVSALIAMPAIAYAGMPFFRSAFSVIRHGRTNMDVPISVGVCLVTGMSLAQTMAGGVHTYFDSAVTLLFFLLIGRVLDHRARGQARATAEQLLMLRGADVQVIGADGALRRCRGESVSLGDRVLVGMGERVGVDGVVVQGRSLLDASLISGESVPVAAEPGTQVFAGTLNLGPPLTVRVAARGDSTLLAECARLVEAAEARRGRVVVLADRVSRAYTPVVHLAALASFLWWHVVAGAGWTQSLLTASAVLIVTCPCALALAVPAVQVITTGRLFRAGILLKSPTALERLAAIDTVLFDKTGTLTEPALALDRTGRLAGAVLHAARSLAAASRHPLARALVAADPAPVIVAEGVVEQAGEGLCVHGPDGETRLGSAAYCGVTDAAQPDGPELWFRQHDAAPVRFRFTERLRCDARETIDAVRQLGLHIGILSGDREGPVEALARALGVDDFRAGCSPVDKVGRIEALGKAGHLVLMVGDGLNDGPCLAAASVSASPATGADISQTVADIVFQGAALSPVIASIRAARRARAAMRQNLALAVGYNLVLVPLAMAGEVTPWLAAAAMSSSSLLVMANSFRQSWRRA
jgi:Cu2+-exporting ATPase